MKKIMMMALVCLAIVGCSGEKGKDFIGVWKSTTDGEVITISQAAGGYRAESTGTIWDMEFMLKAESDTMLINGDSNTKALELNGGGMMVSHLRNGVKEFSKQ